MANFAEPTTRPWAAYEMFMSGQYAIGVEWPIDYGTLPPDTEMICRMDGKGQQARADQQHIIACVNAMGSLTGAAIPADVAAVVGAARNLLEMAEAWCIDWALFSPTSDDFDPTYKPDFPPPVVAMRALLDAIPQEAPQ